MQEKILLKYRIIQPPSFNFIVVIMKEKARKRTQMLIQFNSNQMRQKDRLIQVPKKDLLKRNKLNLIIKDLKEK